MKLKSKILELVQKLNEIIAIGGVIRSAVLNLVSGMSELSFLDYFGNTVIVFHLTHYAALIDYATVWSTSIIWNLFVENDVCFEKRLTTR